MESTKKKARATVSVRERLLDIAEDLMSRRGYAGTSVAEIVEAAGVRAPALYWHFENKEGVLAAVMERGAATWYAGLPRFEDVPGASAAERLVAAMVAAGRAIEADPQFLRLLILLSFERGQSDESVVRAIRAIRGQARSWLASLFRGNWPALDEAACDLLASLAMAYADGWCVMHMIEPGASEKQTFGLTAEILAREADRMVEAICTH